MDLDIVSADDRRLPRERGAENYDVVATSAKPVGKFIIVDLSSAEARTRAIDLLEEVGIPAAERRV